jgi:hypothetical protein
MDKTQLLQFVRDAIHTVPEVIPYLSRDAIKAIGGGYEAIQKEYWAVVYDAVYDYLTGDKSITSFRNAHMKGMATAFTSGAEAGYQDAEAELPLDEDTQSWLDGRIGAEREFIVGLFATLKNASGIDPSAEAFARADGFTATLDAVYAEAKLRGMKNQMVTWNLGETEKHCETCARLAGKRHRISYLLQNDYIPRKPGAAMDCGGWRCDCSLTDKNGNEIML